MNFRCLIIDDEPNAVALLESHLEHVDFLDHVMSCYDAFEAINYLRKETVDIIFMDIEMPEMSGMELATLIPKNVALIFTTAYSEYAVESYQKRATDYLLKPITFSRFMDAVMKACDRLSPAAPATNAVPGTTTAGKPKSASQLFIKSGKEIIRMECESILYLEGDKEYVDFHTDKGIILVNKRMKNLAEMMDENFQRIHHSYIVNVDHILKIEDNQVWIANRKLPISDTYRKAFMSFINRKLY
ncbi:LytR/AlgR family response regulator transcription factor [Pedobacter caeni]|uniref:Two component transcriptional regulator, LytTR family n=1 Tax=Pedobacter caeni TaxID=288992 RepID=A0A1M4W1Q9_9SPHI|nr:LytTR family DNA-binding domain-containing protein [Pedobacter caeni]SHE75168.1 two component transcriptional regulator, LytTR family [Pedobacter caeni]